VEPTRLRAAALERETLALKAEAEAWEKEIGARKLEEVAKEREGEAKLALDKERRERRRERGREIPGKGNTIESHTRAFTANSDFSLIFPFPFARDFVPCSWGNVRGKIQVGEKKRGRMEKGKKNRTTSMDSYFCIGFLFLSHRR